MANRFIITEEEHQKLITTYQKSDGITALIYYLLYLIIYYVVGSISARSEMNLGVPVNLGLVLLCLGIVVLRGQTLTSVGLSTKNMKKSLIAGFAWGIIFLCINFIPGLIAGRSFIDGKNLLYNIFYYTIPIALVEEIVFRGYIQTRLYGIIESDTLALIAGSVLFSLMHIPWQISSTNLGLGDYLLENGIALILLAVWHLVFTYLHRKYQTLTAPTIAHALLDLGTSLLR